MGRIITENFIKSIGFPRALLGLSLIFALLFNSVYDFFPKEFFEIGKLGPWKQYAFLNFFYLFDHQNLAFAKWIAIGILALVVLGVYPAITCLLHSWVSYSFITSSILVEGGDQLNALISLFLIPFCFEYGTRNSWKAQPVSTNKTLHFIREISHHSIALQMSVCYLTASLAKIMVPEWSNGTALYYWLNHNVFGAQPVLMHHINPMLSNLLFLYALTIGVILIELSLGLAIFLVSKKTKRILFWIGLAFHFGIWLFVGLGPFSMVMVAGLYLYLIHMPSMSLAQLYQYGKISTEKRIV